MMKTTLPIHADFFQRLFISIILLLPGFIDSNSQSYKGKDGAASYTSAGTYILNRYTTLAASASLHSLSVTVSNIAELSGSYSFPNSVNPYATNALSAGDMIMIIQVQGADITTTDDANYGAITDYKNTGNYELRTVFNVTGNMILLCQPLAHDYTQGGRSRTQVIRVPRLSTLAVSAGVTITGLSWSSAGTGGVVAIETNNTITLNGTISANAIGFAGGIDDKTSSVGSGGAALLLYRTTSATTTAGKGESIAGNTADYNSMLNGAYGRGAVANGGGGGNGHNSGGGGGANAGNNGALTPWNGTGLKNISTPAWATAWDLESASFSTDISTGGGRGGYSYANSNQDALLLGPNGNAWGGDYRHNVGGLGGRPLNYSGDTRLFLGGGGGAGDGNNSAAGNGGNGGGIVYILSNGNISGTGVITANGQQGFHTQSANIDAAGGAGGGGSIVALVQGTISTISMQANGGNGGNQLLLSSEAEGPGGGGGGGYIVTTTTSVTRTVNGGDNGISQSALVTEFLPNGATQGAAGTVATKNFEDVQSCSVYGYILPVTLVSFNALLQDSKVALEWVTTNEIKTDRFEIERSIDGQHFSSIALVFATGAQSGKTVYNHHDDMAGAKQPVIYYRLKMIDTDNKYLYSDTRMVKLDRQTSTKDLIVYPNPVQNELRITLPANWQGKKVGIEMFDVSGKLVRSIVRTNAAQAERIDLHDLAAGLYIIRTKMGTETAQQRIIKN